MSFLFEDYLPNRMYSEPVVLLGRALIIGGVSLCGNGAARAAVGTGFSLAVIFLSNGC